MNDSDKSNGELVAVVQIFRHGERTPDHFYKNDPYSTYWKGKLQNGQLTNKGKLQMVQLAEATRVKYSNFLPAQYDNRAIMAYTTDFDRTHMSGQCYLYGLFRADGHQVWKKDLDWQPIPLYSLNKQIMNGFPFESSEYIPLWKDIGRSEEYKLIDQKYQDVYEYLSIHTGNKITRFYDTLVVFDCLRVESSCGLQLPDWTKSIFPEPLNTLGGIAMESFSHTTKLKKLAIGPFLNEIIRYFYKMVEDNSYSQRYQVYSAHDLNLIAILNTFGALDIQDLPNFASSIWFELRRKQNNHFVYIFYRNNNETKQICIQGYSTDCLLEDFKLNLQDVLVDLQINNNKYTLPFDQDLGEKYS